MFVINFSLNMFRASLCPSSGEQRPCYCIWCIALVLLDVIDSGCGALRCRMRALYLRMSVIFVLKNLICTNVTLIVTSACQFIYHLTGLDTIYALLSTVIIFHEKYHHQVISN